MSASPDPVRLSNEEAVMAFTGPNSRYYLYKWFFTRGLGKWNWAAALFGPFWFAFRRQYGWSLVLAAAYLVFDFFWTANPLVFTFSIELMLFSGLIATPVYGAAFQKAWASLPEGDPETRRNALKKAGQVDVTAPLFLLAGMLACTLFLPSLFNIQLFQTQVRGVRIAAWSVSWFIPDQRAQELGDLRRDYQQAFFRGNFQSAISLAENTVRLAAMKLGRENQFTIAMQSDLLSFKLKTGDHKSALQLSENLLRLYQSQFGEDHLFSLFMMNQLASNYIYQGRYDLARPFANNCLITLEKYPKDLKHPVILGTLAQIYSNLGVINQAFCKYDEAEKFHIEALNQSVQASKGYTLDSCLFLERMGDLYKTMLKIDQAEAYFEQAKEIAEQMVGKENPLVSSVYLKLGEVKYIRRQYLQAEYLTAHAHVVNQKYFGDRHAATAASACQLGKVYFSQGRFHDAEYQITQALEITRNALGEDNALYAAYLIQMTDLYIFQNNFVAAENALAKSLALYEQIYGKQHAMLLVPLEQMAFLYEKKKNPVLEQIVKLRIRAIEDQSIWRPDTKHIHRLALDDLMI